MNDEPPIDPHEQDAWDKLTPKQKNQWLFEQAIVIRKHAHHLIERLDRLEKIHPLPVVIVEKGDK